MAVVMMGLVAAVMVIRMVVMFVDGIIMLMAIMNDPKLNSVLASSQ